MTNTDWITLGIGSYAAIVASIALIWNIRRERHTVIVRPRFGLTTGGYLGDNTVEFFVIEVINKGVRPIKLEEAGFIMSDNHKLAISPHILQLDWLRNGDGKSFRLGDNDAKDAKELAKKRSARITHIYVRDSTNTYYKGKVSKGMKWLTD